MKNKTKIIIVLLSFFMLTGCTTYLKVDKKAVKYEKTGQIYYVNRKTKKY